MQNCHYPIQSGCLFQSPSRCWCTKGTSWLLHTLRCIQPQLVIAIVAFASSWPTYRPSTHHKNEAPGGSSFIQMSCPVGIRRPNREICSNFGHNSGLFLGISVFAWLQPNVPSLDQLKTDIQVRDRIGGCAHHSIHHVLIRLLRGHSWISSLSSSPLGCILSHLHSMAYPHGGSHSYQSIPIPF